MENKEILKPITLDSPRYIEQYVMLVEVPINKINSKKKPTLNKNYSNYLAEILVITSYPPRVCGIASYSYNLIQSLNNKYSDSFSIKICALNSNEASYDYPKEVEYVLNTSVPTEYEKLALAINLDSDIKIVFIQHEFGFFYDQEQFFLKFLYELTKPVIITFHTVLTNPNEILKLKLRSIVALCKSIIVMTQTSANILINEYGIQKHKITVIPKIMNQLSLHEISSTLLRLIK